jgi:hypothetical protein
MQRNNWRVEEAMNPRSKKLLRMAAEKFRECSNPFDTDVLVEHDITASECYDLSQSIAHAIDFFVRNHEQFLRQYAEIMAVHAVEELRKDAEAARAKVKKP